MAVVEARLLTMGVMTEEEIVEEAYVGAEVRPLLVVEEIVEETGEGEWVGAEVQLWKVVEENGKEA